MTQPDSNQDKTSPDDPPLFAWRTLPLEVLRVLRAGATVGVAFEARVVAALLECPPLAVLERLQDAADLGVPLEPAGDDAFSLPPALQAALAASILPSLARAWGERLAALRAAEAPVPAPAPSASLPPVPMPRPAAVSSAIERTEVGEATKVGEDLSRETAAAAEPEPTTSIELSLADAEIVELDEAVFMPTPADARPRSLSVPPPPPGAASRSRMAAEPRVYPRLEDAHDEGHLHMDFLAEAREAADRGEPQVAMEHLQRALGQLGSQPATPAYDRLRALGRIELGRLQWQAAGPELGFTLAQALTTLDTARAELGDGVPDDLAAELAQVVAGVCCELGDVGSLARAREELQLASRLLRAAGDALRADRLLNEEAAVLMRLGDARKAYELLRASRQVFQARDPDDPITMRELAETDHLTACLPLYAVMVAGREHDGYRMGLERAFTAEKLWRQLGDTRELARVWETMGQLERRLERHDEAIQHLEAASEAQRKLGDLTGLARTSEGLSEVLGLCGRDAEAIALLRASVEFNRDKGSLVGLFHNRRTFTNLVVRLGPQTGHAAAIQDVAVLLGRAERAVETGRPRQSP